MCTCNLTVTRYMGAKSAENSLHLNMFIMKLHMAKYFVYFSHIPFHMIGWSDGKFSCAQKIKKKKKEEKHSDQNTDRANGCRLKRVTKNKRVPMSTAIT